ncbi:MAG TPA: polymer-forming cytoskeletal protein [Longimicrobiales bacterium]
MFRKAEPASDTSPQPRNDNRIAGRVPEERRVAAWIGASLLIEGNLTSSENMTVAGQVDGDITVREHALLVAAGGIVRGNIVARAVVVHGEVLGKITADARVEIAATGSVDGDIIAPRMMLAEGATVHGRVGIAATSPTSRQGG